MSSPNISFDSIPSSIRKPGRYTEFNTSLAVSSLPENDVKVVILAQKTASGSGTADTPVRIFTTADAILYGGTGSIAHLSCKAALNANKNIKLWVVPIDDAAGTPAEGTITIAGIASAAGSIDIWIGNEWINVPVANAAAVNSIASDINDAINLIEWKLPVTSAVVDAVVTLTARNDGLLGNSIPVAYRINDVATTTVVVVQPVNGATDPSIANALTAIYPADYNKVTCTLNDATNLALLDTHLGDISGPTEDRPATGYFGYTGVQATVETLCGTTLNEERMSCSYIKYTKTTERGHSLDYEVGSAYTAVIASEEDPARPHYGMVLPGIAPCALENQLSRSQQESTLENGVTPLEVVTGEQVAIVRAITTYTTNSAGVADVSMLDLTTILTLDYVKLAIETRQALRFPRSKLSEKTPEKVRTQVIDVMKQLETLEIVEKVDANLDGIIVERDSVDNNRVNCKIPTDVVNGLAVLANRIDLIL
jgi:phage tail sheath gpL-like